MKRFFCFSLGLFILTNIHQITAQVVTFTPSFATENDSLVIVFDATEGNGALEGFTGDVYLHTGVITTESTNNTDWRYVPNGWDEYPEKVRATSLGDNKWEFKYLPNIRDFFGITNESEQVLEVAMLFRGTNTGVGDPVSVGRDSDGGDIFVELFEGEILAKWEQPIEEVTVVNPGEEVEFLGLGTTNSGTLTLQVFLNEVRVDSVENDSVSYTFSSEITGNFELTLIADNGSGLADTTSSRVVVYETVYESRPEGLRDGITYSDAAVSDVYVSLFAPEKENVFVIGDFNDWQADFNYALKKDSVSPGEVWFWTEITNLTPGEEYGYQYLIDESIRIVDPYSELVLDQNHDPFIPESVFPNLKEYPTGKTSGLVGLLQPGKDEFIWSDDEYVRPEKENLVIYELLIRDFLEDRSYQSLIDTLDYLERLGINAIELMPINEFDGNDSWGYNPASHYAIDKYYGTPEKFKEFVNEAHNRGIAVIIDIVLNHGTGAHPLYQMYEFGSNPYFNTEARHSYNVFNDFNHQYFGTQRYVQRVVEHWINEYRVDGFRWDLTKGFTQNCTESNEGCTNSYQQDRVDILKQYADYQWEADSSFIIIHEHLGTDAEETEWADYRIDEGKGIMLWGKANFEYNEATMGYINDSNLFNVLSESRSFQKRHLVGYMESHDEQWLMFKNRRFGACENFPEGGDGCDTDPGDYNVRELSTALGRQKLAGAFFFTLPGPKMLWQFGEVGYGYGDNGEQCLNDSADCPPFAPGRTEAKPIRWDYWNSPDTEERVKLYKTWAALINLRNSSPAFTNPNSAIYNLSNQVKEITLQHEDSDVFIVGNFGVSPTSFNTDFPTTGTWYDFFEGTSFDISGTQQFFTLAAGEFKVFTTKEFETPETGISVSNEEDITEEIPLSFKLYPNYPNPFNPTTTITYEVANNAKVSLEVYNVLGQKVRELVNEIQTPGVYTVSFDATGLSSGIYFTRFVSGGTIYTQKMMLLK